MTVIQSPKNPTVKRLISWRNHRRRRAAGVVLVDGPREAWRAVEAGWNLRAFYEPVDPDGRPLAMRAAFASEIECLRAAAVRSDRHVGVVPGVFEKLRYGDLQSPCLVELDARASKLADLPEDLHGLILVLDGVEKPGNLGAVFRSADAAGVSAVILSDCPGDVMNPNAIRGSLGAVFTVPHAAATAHDVAEFLHRRHFRTLAMRVEGASELFDQSLLGDVAVVLGSEADGLGDRWPASVLPAAGDASAITAVALPMRGRVDSLNVSVSAAIVAFESVRQRSAAGAMRMTGTIDLH